MIIIYIYVKINTQDKLVGNCCAGNVSSDFTVTRKSVAPPRDVSCLLRFTCGCTIRALLVPEVAARGLSEFSSGVSSGPL
jgi:hypothetical protein